MASLQAVSLEAVRPVQAEPEGGLQATVERLREEIRKVQAAPREYLFALRTGVSELDQLGAFRLGGAVELSGELASGRTSLALTLLARCTRERRLAAWVDGPKELYPPAAASLGVDLARLLLVRPQAPGQLVWSAVQLLRSGAFACVVLDVSRTGVRVGLNQAKKLADAARAGGSLLVLLSDAGAHAEGLARLHLGVEAGPGAEADSTASRPGPLSRMAGEGVREGGRVRVEPGTPPIPLPDRGTPPIPLPERAPPPRFLLVTAARRAGPQVQLRIDRARLRGELCQRRCVRPRSDTPRPGLASADRLVRAKEYLYRVKRPSRDDPPPPAQAAAGRHGEALMVHGIRGGRMGRDGARPSLKAPLARFGGGPEEKP